MAHENDPKSGKPGQTGGSGGGGGGSGARQKRLAAALRENLRRRKAQTRGREQEAPSEPNPAQPCGSANPDSD